MSRSSREVTFELEDPLMTLDRALERSFHTMPRAGPAKAQEVKTEEGASEVAEPDAEEAVEEVVAKEVVARVAVAKVAEGKPKMPAAMLHRPAHKGPALRSP